MRSVRSPKLLAASGLACLLSVLALPALIATPANAYLGESKSQTFTEIGKTLHFIAPADASVIHILAIGGSGAAGRTTCTTIGFCRKGGTGGHGGTVEMDLPVTAGQDLQIVLGGSGTNVKPGGGGASGGFAGQDSEYLRLDDGVGHGGGATYIYRSDASVIAAAAGGGGGGGASDSGENPTGIGGDGGDGLDGRGYAGHDGTTAGAGGTGSSGKQSGGNGQSAASDVNAGGGGGGGGGYQPNSTGGGAGGRAGKELLVGGAGGGGAGGHSFSVDSNAATAAATGYGDGKVVITWTSNRATFQTTGTLTSSANPSWLGEPVTFNVDPQLAFWGNETRAELGIFTIGTVDPATGGELPQAYFDLSLLTGTKSLPDGLSWRAVLPVGRTQVWASYSGDKQNTPWKSPYLTQLVGPVRPRAVLVLPSSSVDFGAQSVGTVTTKTVTVENNSAAPWMVTSAVLSKAQFRLTGGTCWPTAVAVALNESCTIDVSFRPVDVAPVGGALTLTDEVGNPTVISLAGSGITATTTTNPTTTTVKPTTTTTAIAAPATTTTIPTTSTVLAATTTVQPTTITTTTTIPTPTTGVKPTSTTTTTAPSVTTTVKPMVSPTSVPTVTTSVKPTITTTTARTSTTTAESPTTVVQTATTTIRPTITTTTVPAATTTIAPTTTTTTSKSTVTSTTTGSKVPTTTTSKATVTSTTTDSKVPTTSTIPATPTTTTSLPVTTANPSVPAGTTPAAAAVPTVSRVSPAFGSRRGGTTVTITGTNLVNLTSIRFGSNLATAVKCVAATTCTVRSPRGSDRVNVKITTIAGTSAASSAARFRYTTDHLLHSIP
jgi:Abnormal spindle-like microcephaly-assoc'd, ASPM-SPD-2-Hydin